MSLSCARCAALIADDDLERHEDFCGRVNASLPFRACGETHEPVIPGVVLKPCHARYGHAGPHIFDAVRSDEYPGSGRALWTRR